MCSAGFEHIECWFHSMPPKLYLISVPIEARLAVLFWMKFYLYLGTFMLSHSVQSDYL